MSKEAFKNFSFEIGDLVFWKNEAAIKKSKKLLREIAPMTIVERYLQEYHGGYQKGYGIRMFSTDGPRLVIISEVELTKYILPELESK